MTQNDFDPVETYPNPKPKKFKYLNILIQISDTKDPDPSRTYQNPTQGSKCPCLILVSYANNWLESASLAQDQFSLYVTESVTQMTDYCNCNGSEMKVGFCMLL